MDAGEIVTGLLGILALFSVGALVVLAGCGFMDMGERALRRWRARRAEGGVRGAGG